MRLIDADERRKRFRSNANSTNDEILWNRTVRRMISEQSTAYDLEKVIESIHDYFKKVIDDFNGNVIPLEILDYNKAICDIVRKGGVKWLKVEE